LTAANLNLVQSLTKIIVLATFAISRTQGNPLKEIRLPLFCVALFFSVLFPRISLQESQTNTGTMVNITDKIKELRVPLPG